MTLIEKIKDIDQHWKALFISTTLVLVTGILPSIYFSEWTWFSRSGALLVMYGIYIVWLDYQGRIDDGLTTILEATEKKFGELSEEFIAL